MPNYIKFLKAILSNKCQLKEHEIVAQMQECIAAVKNKLPTKLKDSRSFTIPCSIGGINADKTLCDIGASINLMLLSAFKRLRIDATMPTTVTLRLTNISIKHSEGKSEDGWVKVNSFIFHANFIVLGYKVDIEVSIILGHSFLTTGLILIHVKHKKLTMQVNDEKCDFQHVTHDETP